MKKEREAGELRWKAGFIILWKELSDIEKVEDPWNLVPLGLTDY